MFLLSIPLLLLQLFLPQHFDVTPSPSPEAAFTCTTSWIAAVDGLWSDAGKWDNGVPGSGDNACITISGTPYTVTVIGVQAARSVFVESGDATLAVSADPTTSQLTASNGITNTGTLLLKSISGTGGAFLVSSGGNILNGGVISITTGSGGSRVLGGDLINHGQVLIDTHTDQNGDWTNNAAFEVLGGATLNATSGDSFTQASGTLTVTGYIMSSGVFNFNGGSIGGVPELTGSTLNIGPLATGAGTFSLRGTSQLSGDISPFQEIRVNGFNSAALVTAAGSFTNAGVLLLETISGLGSSTFTIGSGGTVTNTGLISITTGTGGLRTFDGGLVNNNMVKIDATTTQNGEWTNNATFTVSGGADLNASLGDIFNHDAGTLSVNGLIMNGAFFNFGGGVINGIPELTSSELYFGPTATGAATFSLRGNSTMLGNISPFQEVRINGTGTLASVTAAGPFTNAGVLLLETITGGGGSSFSIAGGGAVTNTGLISITTGTGGTRTFNGGLINNAVVKIDANTTHSGEWTNNATFTIGGGAEVTSSSGDLFNQDGGTLTVNGLAMSNATFNFNGGDISGIPVLTSSELTFGPASTGAGTFSLRGNSTMLGNIGAFQEVRVNGTGTLASVTAAGPFTNAGVILLETIAGSGSSNFTIAGGGVVTNTGLISITAGTGGLRVFDGGLVNNGVVKIDANTTHSGEWTNNATFTISGGAEVNSSLGDIFNQDGGALSVNGLAMSNATFNFNGGDISGIPVLTNSELTFGPTSTGAGTFSLRGNSTMLGNIGASQEVRVNGTGTLASVTAAGPFTNAGVLLLETITGSGGSTFVIAGGGGVTNTGLIDILPGTGGTRTFTGGIVNNNQVQITANTTQNGEWKNNATFTIGGGADVTASSGDIFTQNGGTLTVNGLKMSNGVFNFTGGVIAGVPELTASELYIETGTLGAATFSMRGNSTLLGNIAAAQEVRINGTASAASLTSASSFSNAGTILLETVTGSGSAALNVTTGTLTNTGTISVTAGTGGLRTINAELLNRGNVAIKTAVNFSNVAHNHVNDTTGLITVDNAAVTMAGTLTNNGEMRETKNVPNTTNTIFLGFGGYGGVEIEDSNGGLGDTTVIIRGNQACSGALNAVFRCFEINPTTATGRNANVKFYYTSGELNGNECSLMLVYRFAGGSWGTAGALVTRNCVGPLFDVTTNGVTDFSPFALADATPTAVTLRTAGATGALPAVAPGVLVLALVTLVVGWGVRRGE